VSQARKIRQIRLGSISRLALWRSRPIRYLVLCGVLLIAAIIASTSIMVDNLRDRALFDSERELKNTALILAEQIDRSFQAVDLVQGSVIEKIEALGIASSEDFARRMSGEDVHQMLKTSISGVVQASAITLINADGRLLNFSRYWPGPDINIDDREFFKALKSDSRLMSYVSLPGHNRTNGAWTLFLARKVTAANGDFLGLVLGVVELSYFDKLFSSVSLGEGSSIGLYRSDGRLLTRFPQAESFIGTIFTSPSTLWAVVIAPQFTSPVKSGAWIVCWRFSGSQIFRCSYQSAWIPVLLSPSGKSRQTYLSVREVLPP
jgi:Cache domain